jgi:hypothetical protein
MAFAFMGVRGITMVLWPRNLSDERLLVFVCRYQEPDPCYEPQFAGLFEDAGF